MAIFDKKDAKLEKIIYAEKLRLLYQKTFPADLISLVLAGFLAYLLGDVQEPEKLRNWFIVLVLATTVRLVFFFEFWRRSPTLHDTAGWAKPYFITLLVAALIWGFGIPSLMPEDSPFHQLVIMFFLAAVVVISVSSYWPYRRLLLPVTLILLFPTTVWLTINSPDDVVVLAVLIAALGLFFCLVRFGHFTSGTLTENLRRTHELAEEKKKVEYLSRRDELTNLYNHRAFYEQLNEIGAYCERHRESIAIIIADIDRLKEINDNFGEEAGDQVLAQVGKLFKKHTRISDICARIGGEEFGILIRSSSLEEAELLAEKLREIIASTELEAGDQTLKVTASFGMACDSTDFGNTVRKADKAMYEAKAQGGNTIVRGMAA